MRTEKRIGMFLCVLTVLCMLPAKEVRAYFTTYTESAGGHVLILEPETKIKERYKDSVKQIQVENIGQADCFVRVKVLSGDKVALLCKGEGWAEKDDGYWYYKDILTPGSLTRTLAVTVTVSEGWQASSGSVNVIVIQECAPVCHREGSLYGNWDHAVPLDRADRGREGEGV